MTESEKKLVFVSFCIEEYKTLHGMDGRSVADLFEKYGVTDYLLEHYSVLHSFGREAILNDIDHFLNVRMDESPQTDRPGPISHGESAVSPEIRGKRGGTMPAQITQENVRLLIPGKAAGVAVLMSEKRSISPKAALLAFYRSKTYRELERESSKYWHYSPEQLYVVGGLSRHAVKHGPGRSALLPFRKEILSLWRKRKSARAIADELTKHGIRTTPQNVWKFIKRHDVD